MLEEIYNDMLNLFMVNPNNIIVAGLALSIFIVFISILYVLLQAPQPPKVKIKDTSDKEKTVSSGVEIKSGKTKKVKYTKEFLRRVEGLDLELKESLKK